MTFTVRDAARDDVPRIVALLGQLSLAAEGAEGGAVDAHDPAYARAFDDIAADPRQRLLVVVDDGGAVVATGTVRITPNLSHRGRPLARVESVVVDEAVRGQGAGRALMQFIEDLARDAGCFRIELTSNKARTDAHRFYEALGYAPTHVGFKKKLT